jgi:hypothetical protein
MFTKHKFQTIGLLGVTLLLAAAAFGQGIVTGSIVGTVQDPQGAVVAGAKVSAKDAATNREFVGLTTSSGTFALRGLPVGSYNMRIEAGKFRAYEVQGLPVNAGTEASVGVVQMTVGSVSETLTVEGAPPLVEATTDQLAQTFSSAETADLPIGNNFDSLALFVPGVAPAGDAGFSNTNGAGIVSNGLRGRANNFEIDGQGNNDNSIGGPSIFFGNQDAIQEIQVITNYSAEYGKDSGSVVNYITKSGSNAFHGTGFEFYQGSFADSLENQEKSSLFGFGPSNPPKVSRFVENRFGGTVGGPVMKDKIWFFGSTNFDRIRTGQSPSTSGPSAITPDPTGLQALQTAFPGNPGVAALLAIGPYAVKAGNPKPIGAPVFDNVTVGLTTATIEEAQVQRSITSLFNDREFTGRVDFKLSDKDNFNTRYVFQQTINTGVNFGNGTATGDWETVPGRDQQLAFNWTRSFSNTFVNAALLSYSRANFAFNSGATPTCVIATPTACPTDVLFIDGVTSNFGLASGFPQGRIINVYAFADNATVSRGSHTLKMGGEYDLQRSPNTFLPNNNGIYFYGQSGDGLSDLLNNNALQTRLTLGNPKLPFSENDLAFYFQDDWKVQSNLTLNLGLRWEWNQQAVNLLHDRSLAQQTGTSPFWNTSLPLSQTTVPHVPQTLHNFTPVLGFAWTPQFGGKLLGENQTVLRGGFRISYDPSFYNIFLNVATSAPTVNAATLSGVPNTLPTSGFFGTDVQAAVGPLIPNGVNPGIRNHTTVDPNFHNPYTEQWNLGLQRSIGSKVAIEARYVGNHAVGLFQSRNGNPALGALIADGFQNLIPSGLTPCSDTTQPGYAGGAGYANCNFRRVVTRGNTASSNYNSIQSQLRISHWHGVSATAAYTFSKTIDNASEIFSTIAGGSTVSFAQNPFDISGAERARSGIDYPHTVGLTLMYDLPFAKSQQGLLGHLAGGWQLNTTYRYTSGEPYTTIQLRHGGDCDPTSVLSGTYDACRPILHDGRASLGSSAQYCDGSTASDECPSNAANTTVFPLGTLVSPFDGCLFGGVNGDCAVTPVTTAHWVVNDSVAAQILGSPYKGVARNSLRGQAVNTVNLAVFKDTNLGEKLKLEFQAQAFNVMNHAFLGNPDPLLDDQASFQNTSFNANGGATSTASTTYDGIGRRRLLFGLKLIF